MGWKRFCPAAPFCWWPFFVDVFIGETLRWPGDRAAFMRELDRRIRALGTEGRFPPWE